MKKIVLTAALVVAALTGAIMGAGPVGADASKIHRPHGPDGFAPAMTPAAQSALETAVQTNALNTVPTWTHGFSINGTTYHYTLIGSAPSTGITTNVPVVIVPIRLTVSDYAVGGKPLVLDAKRISSHIIASPIFTPVLYGTEMRQFVDGMYHAEFPTTAAGWGMVFTATVGAGLNLTSPAGAVGVRKVGTKYLATIKSAHFLDSAITAAAKAAAAPGTIYLFVTYNALENSAFGYHTFANATVAGKPAALIYMYSSWLEGVDSAFSVPSPDAATLAHEIAETAHDPLITSRTLLWGDAFHKNKCFMRDIEVGDAVEDAPAAIQLYSQAGFTVQVEANLAWFTRDTRPGTTYSFPRTTAFKAPPAPLTCN